MQKLVPGLFIILCCSAGCTNKKQQSVDTYELVKTGKQLSFLLDPNTKSFILALFPYRTPEGKEYLTFQNQGQNEILFYDMESQQLEFKIKPAYEGNNGVGEFIGYYVHTPDSIFLTSLWEKHLILIDRNAVVKDKIKYEQTDEGYPLCEYYATSSRHKPLIVIGQKLYIQPGCNRWAEKNPVCATIDLQTGSVEAFLSFPYPSFPGSDNKAKRASVEEDVSRCFNGSEFVYAFFFDEDLYVTSPDHEQIRRVKAKSRYIDKVKILDDYGNLTPEDICENPNYGNMLYDEYRQVYYRISYPETEIEKGVRGMELLQYGRKRFSIIILDNDLNIMGETLFPDYTYNSSVLFIREDGLYISNSHYMNSDYSDDVLGFDCFELVKR